MQISIDANTASPTALRLTAAILTFIANFKENPQNAGLPIPPITQPVAPPAPPAPPAAASPAAEPPAASQEAATGSSESAGSNDVTALLDSAGEQWNPELHTANQSKNTDGTWRRKRTPRGETPAAPKTVELPKAPQVPPPPPSPAKAVEPVLAVPPAPSAPAATPAVAAAVVPPVPTGSTVSSSPLAEFGGDTFAALVKYVMNLVGSKTLSTTAMFEACLECGVPDLHACSKPENTALIPAVALAISKRLAK